jgi:RNA polymerase-binding transcription factor DksA
MSEAQLREIAHSRVDSMSETELKIFIGKKSSKTKGSHADDFVLTKDDKYNMRVLGITSIKEYKKVLEKSKQADKDIENGDYVIVSDINAWKKEILGT